MIRISLAALLCCIASAAPAQSSRDSAVAQIVPTLSPGTRIRIGLLRERWTGRYVGTNGDTLFLAGVGGPPMAIRFNAVDTLWLGVPATRRGAVIGGLLGTAFGVALVAGFDDWDDAPAIVATFGGLSAVGGAILGSFGRRWKRIHP